MPAFADSDSRFGGTNNTARVACAAYTILLFYPVLGLKKVSLHVLFPLLVPQYQPHNIITKFEKLLRD